jgi:spore maturation protein CgeB
MRILLVYPGTRHSTYDIALGYHEALEELGHEIRPYNFHDYLDYHGGAIKFWKEENPEFNPTDDQIGEMWMRWSSEPLIIHIIESAPDLILIVGGLALHANAYRLMGRFNIPKAVILTESPYIDEKQSRILIDGGVHLAFTNEKASVAPLRAMTDRPVEYLPHSIAPSRHYPGTENGFKTNVFFHGTWWPERGRLFCDVHKMLGGRRTRIVGVGWEDGIGHAQHVTPNDELANWYRGTDIALNHHRTITTIGDEEKHIPTGIAQSIGPRAYEIAACGAFQLCDDTRPELGEVFGDSVATYADAEDLLQKIEYYLAHPGEREEMALASRARVAFCRFADRTEQILLPVIERELS